MGIAEFLREHAGAAKAVASLVILICLVSVFRTLWGTQHVDASVFGKEFYSDDDGKSWFLDDASKGSPFTHNGKEADRVLVFRCGTDGRPFAAFLGQYSDEQRARWQKETGGNPAAASRVQAEAPRKFKTPGSSVWKVVPPGGGFPAVQCPSGNADAIPVSPFDADNGAK